MNERREGREVVTILCLCLMWYIVSSSSNVVGKLLLSDFPYPMTVTMVQLTSITLYSGPFFNLWGVRKYASDISWGYYLRLIVPLALGKFVGNVFSHVSIWKVPVSYAHTGMNRGCFQPTTNTRLFAPVYHLSSRVRRIWHVDRAYVACGNNDRKIFYNNSSSSHQKRRARKCHSNDVYHRDKEIKK